MNGAPDAQGIRALALETSGKISSVALALGGRAIAEQSFSYGLAQAAKLVAIVDDLCHSQRWKPADLAEIYVSTGPGSFTGLRIGVTLAKTLALATGAKIAAVPSLLVLAHNAPAEATNILVALDAKRGQVYCARFTRDQSGVHVAADAHLETLPAALAAAPRPLWLLSLGVAASPENQLHILAEDRSVARASIVAQLGHAMLRRAAPADPDTLVPLYIRRPEAEEKADAAQSRPH